MPKYRLFLTATLSFIALFALGNFAVWKLYTDKLITKEYYRKIGGLCRIGYITEVMEIRTNFVDLPKKHWELTDFPGGVADVIVLGDSFANEGVKGKNPYFQDYIASQGNLTVLNLNPQLFSIYPSKVADFLTLAAVLLNSGWLEKYHPNYFLIEQVERNCLPYLAKPINFQATDSWENINKFNPPNPGKDLDTVNFINNGNLKFLLYNFLYYFNDHAFFSQVYIRKLKQNLFSGKNGNKLLFYHYDIKRIPLATDSAINKLNDNFNHLAEMFRQKNIKLYFMPAVDKYNIYSDYIINNPYPPSVFFEKLRKLPKKYCLIDTKEILSREIKKGEKDIYYTDDTHWSWKGSQAIFETVKFD